MAESPNIALRFSDEEKAALVELAQRFHRSQSSILRVLVCEAVAVLREQDKQIEKKRAIRTQATVRVMK